MRLGLFLCANCHILKIDGKTKSFGGILDQINCRFEIIHHSTA